jgi:hypothetical protein
MADKNQADRDAQAAREQQAAEAQQARIDRRNQEATAGPMPTVRADEKGNVVPAAQTAAELPSPLGLSPNEEKKWRADEREASERDDRRARAEQVREADREQAERQRQLAEQAERERAGQGSDQITLGKYRALREGHIPNAKLGGSVVGTIPPGPSSSMAACRVLGWSRSTARPRRPRRSARPRLPTRPPRPAVRQAAESLAGVVTRP